MKTIALGIPHLPDGGKRDQALLELERRLWIYRRDAGDAYVWDAEEQAKGTGPRGHQVMPRFFTDREPNAVWSKKMWRWGLDSGADFFLTLQDDSDVMPKGFWKALQAMLTVLPKGAALGLSAVHPEAIKVRAQGHRWYRTMSWLVGWGYGLWREDLEALLEFREELGEDAAAMNEDQLVNAFVSATGRSTWHPVPSIVDHDTTLESNYGNDAHTCRRTVVRWDAYRPEELAAPAFWRLQGPEPPPLLGLVVNPSLADVDLIIATPHKGYLHHAHVASVHRTMREAGVRARELDDVEAKAKTVDVRWLQQTEDLVRARSRMVRAAVVAGGSHLLFADADNSWDPKVVVGMLETGKDFVQAPYLRRDGRGYAIHGTKARLEANTTSPLLRAEEIEPDNTTRTEGTGFGLTLLSRTCLDRMLEHYVNEPRPKALDDLLDDESLTVGEMVARAYELGRTHGHRLAYTDRGPTGEPITVVALFQLIIRDRHLYGEDRSFAQRWLDIGGEIWMYLGDGTPIAHHGDHTYQGRIEDFGLKRISK